jgi:hypothetical protein
VNAFKLEDDKISPSVRGVRSSLRSFIDETVIVERVELVLIEDGTDGKLVLLVTFDGSDLSKETTGNMYKNNLVPTTFKYYVVVPSSN